MALESLPKIAPALFSAEQDLIQIYNKKSDTVGVINASLLGGSTPPSGVAGAIQFSDGSAFASDATNFFWNNTTKRLGIGTNTPSAIINSVSSSVAIPSMTMNGIGGNAQPVQRIVMSGTGQYLWAASMMAANMATNNNLFYFIGKAENTNNSAYFGYNHTSDGSASNFATMGLFGVDNVLNITAANRVGIGTTAPTAKLQVNGNGSTSATTSLLVQNSSGTQAFKVEDGGIVQIGLTSGINWDFTSNTLRCSQYAYINSSNGSILTTGGSIGGVFGNNNGGKVADSGISNPQVASAVLEVSSTTRGFLPPRMTTTQKNAITAIAGLVVYDSTTNKLQCYNGSTWNDLF